ncbi:MAG: EamA family transporter [Gemmatimonadota bacterium]
MNMGWIAFGLLAALGGAGVALFGKVGLQDLDPLRATLLRSVVMTLTIALVVWLRRTPSQPVGGRAWIFILLAGGSGALSWLAYFAGLRLAPVAQLAALDRASLLFIFLFGILFLGERYGWRGWVGISLVTAGMILLVTDRPLQSTPSRDAAVAGASALDGDGPEPLSAPRTGGPP